MSFSPSSAKAATAVAKVYSWTDPHGVSHETAYITIGDTIVFCIDPGKPRRTVAIHMEHPRDNMMMELKPSYIMDSAVTGMK